MRTTKIADKSKLVKDDVPIRLDKKLGVPRSTILPFIKDEFVLLLFPTLAIIGIVIYILIN